MTSLPESSPRSNDDLNEAYIGRVANPLVLHALLRVDRARFLPAELKDQAYNDHAVTFAENSSVSQPSLVGKMVDHLLLTGEERVLDIGTGSGWQAAILSVCAEQVHTVEFNPDLAESARQRLQELGFANVSVHVGDGALGLEKHGPFHAIIAGAHFREIPDVLTEQLVEGGRFVTAVGKDPVIARAVVCVRKGRRVIVRTIDNNVWFYKLFSNNQGGWTTELLEKSKALKREQVIKIIESISGKAKDMHLEEIKRQAEAAGIENPNLEELLIEHFMNNIQLLDGFFD